MNDLNNAIETVQKLFKPSVNLYYPHTTEFHIALKQVIDAARKYQEMQQPSNTDTKIPGI